MSRESFPCTQALLEDVRDWSAEPRGPKRGRTCVPASRRVPLALERTRLDQEKGKGSNRDASRLHEGVVQVRAGMRRHDFGAACTNGRLIGVLALNGPDSIAPGRRASAALGKGNEELDEP